MLEKNHTSFQLLTVTLACLSGVLAKTPAATAIPEEEAPTTIEQLDTVKVDAAEVAVISSKPDLGVVPTVENFEVTPLRISAAKLPALEQATEVNFESTLSTVVLATPDPTVKPTVENFEVTPLRTSAAKLPTLGQVTEVNVDATAPTTALTTPVQTTVTTVKDFEATQLGTSADELSITEQPIQANLDSAKLLVVDPAQSVLAQTEGEAESAEAETDATARNDGFYIRLGAGFQNRADAQDFIGRASFDTGYKLNGAVGYRYSDFRAEVEYTYFRNDFDELTFFQPGTTTPVAGPPETSPGSYVDGRALMLNVYYDIPLSRRFRPYIGGGIGVYNAYINELAPPSFGGFEANAFSASRFAFQLRAGLNYAITDSLDISLGYRYFQGNRFEYDIEDSPLELQPNGLETNGAELSLTYTF